MKHITKKLTAAALGALLLCGQIGSSVLPASADAGRELEIHHSYSNNGYTFEKLSHADAGTEQKDGVVNYLGNQQISTYTPGVDDPASADGVQSYSYCAAAYGDWVYIGTMYGALSAYTQVANSLTSMGIEQDAAYAIIDAMFNGKLNKGAEDDGYYAGGVFFKFNVVTGETKLLMSREMYKNGECEGVPIFRNACEYNGKLYFVGLVSQGTALNQYNGYPLSQDAALNLEIRMQTGVPSIYELDPETDELKKVYECVDVAGYRVLNNQNVFTSTRAISTFEAGGKEYLLAGGIVDGSTGDPLGCAVYASEDPSSGDFKVIANQADLFDYPAFNRLDSEGGGGIYQVIQYGENTLYVAMVSGRYNADPELDTKDRPFAIVRGTYDPSVGSVTDKAAWTWSPLAGDTERDGAKYTFGLDPERTASGGVTLQEYNGYLYIGEYNDVNRSMTDILTKQSFHTLANNLSQSINLYRMDHDENLELVVGDATDMFPEGSISGWKSGYETHMTQYTWMTTVFDDVMYLSTMDETSLTHVIAQFVNGELVHMSPEEWESQMNYIKVLVELLKPVEEEPVQEEPVIETPEVTAPETEEAVESPEAAEEIEETEAVIEETEAVIEENEEVAEEPVEEITESDAEEVTEIEPVVESGKKEKKEKKAKKHSFAAQFTDADTAVTAAEANVMIEAAIDQIATVDALSEEQVDEMTATITSGDLDVCEEMLEETVANAADMINARLDALKGMLDTKNYDEFRAAYQALLADYEATLRDKLPEELQGIYNLIINVATLDNLVDFATCLRYMAGSDAGFDLYAIKQAADGSVDITTVTTNGFGDRYNHGLRVFAATDDYLAIGTANPFLGTQIWRMSQTPEKSYSHTVHHYDEGLTDMHKNGKKGTITYYCKECGHTVAEKIKVKKNH